jgi:hypothetical protein
LLKSLNIGIVRWLEPKPCGAYLNGNAVDLLSEEDRTTMTGIYIKANKGIEFKNYPLISYEAYSESPENMGCMMAGHSIIYIDSMGNVEPCVFLPVSFGNIMNEDFSEIFKRMRKAIPRPLHTTCPSIQLSSKIKSKKDNGISLPVPYEELIEEFDSITR